MQDYTYTLRTSVMCEEGVRSLGGLGPTWMA